MDKKPTSEFRISRGVSASKDSGRGVQFMFANNYTVSIQFGEHNYCSNHGKYHKHKKDGDWEASSAECAVYDGYNTWYEWDEEFSLLKKVGTHAEGWMNANDVAKLIALVSSQKPAQLKVPDDYLTKDYPHVFWSELLRSALKEMNRIEEEEIDGVSDEVTAGLLFCVEESLARLGRLPNTTTTQT